MKTTIYIKETDAGEEQVVARFDEPDALETPQRAESIRELEAVVRKVIRQHTDSKDKI